MRIVGLTGGIATGKSTVTALLEGCQVPVVDCDVIAKAVVQKVLRERFCPQQCTQPAGLLCSGRP